MHPVSQPVFVVLGFDDGQRDVGFEVKDVVSPFGLASADGFAPDDDSTSGEGDLFPELGVDVPSCFFDGRGDELGADIPFREALLIHYFFLKKNNDLSLLGKILRIKLHGRPS